MSSIAEEEEFHPIIKQAFTNEKLTGYDIVCNTEIVDLIRKDSSDFATGVINHPRGREIVCEMVDVALRPHVLISYLQKKLQSSHPSSTPSTYNPPQRSLTQSSKQITTIVYNAIQILTNQYEQFVQFIFGENNNNKSEFLKQGKIIDEGIKDEYEVKRMTQSIERDLDHDDDFEGDAGKESWGAEQQEEQKQNLQDCVIMDSGYPELTRNQQDELLQKIISTTKIQHNETYKSSFLDRMFLLFQQPIPIQQTPVSYFNKIMLQFVYQKPQQIMRYFYCDYQRGKSGKQKPNIIENNKSENNKCKKLNKKNTNTISGSLSSSGNLRTPRIRLIARHLYNNSVIELLGHLMQLDSDGNFFSSQKIDILRAITEQVFPSQPVTKPDDKKQQISSQLFMQTQTSLSDLNEQRIVNLVLFLRQMYEKLQDRYEQQKFLSVFKYYVNEGNVIKRIMDYFRLQQHSNGLVSLLTQILKFDKQNFIRHKSQLPPSSPFGGGGSASHDHFGMGSNSTSLKQDSSIASYDIKLSSQVLNEIQKTILLLVKNSNNQQQPSMMKMVQYYDLIYNWLSVVVTDRQQMVRLHVITPEFVDDCMGKFQLHQRASILHNAIKNILVDFLPKLNSPLRIILHPQCHLVQFLQNYLLIDQNEVSQKGKRKVKCFQSQLFHIAKAVLSIWEQQKLLYLNKKTQNQEQDKQEIPFYDKQIITRFQKLNLAIKKKQQFYNHLICGDPRKMGEYQEDQSSQIIIASSSLKNYFKPKSQNTNENDDNNNEILNSKGSQKSSNDRYSGNIDDDEQDEVSKKEKLKKKLDINDLKRDTNLKTNPKFISLRIGVDHSSSLFESAISPLNAYRSHSFNFETDALPLDSDNSEHMSQQQQQQQQQQQDFPLQVDSVNEEAEQMQQNIQNLDMMGGNFVLGMDSNILSNNSISNQRSNNNVILNVDNYRREELCKSMDIPELSMDAIEKVESYNAIESPRVQQSTDEILSLGMNSKNSGSKMSDQQGESRLEVVTSQIIASFVKDEQRSNVSYERMQAQQLSDGINTESVRPYCSYLKYNIDDLCMDLE